jgi:hypothetical protein
MLQSIKVFVRYFLIVLLLFALTLFLTYCVIVALPLLGGEQSHIGLFLITSVVIILGLLIAIERHYFPRTSMTPRKKRVPFGETNPCLNDLIDKKLSITGQLATPPVRRDN